MANLLRMPMLIFRTFWRFATQSQLEESHKTPFDSDFFLSHCLKRQSIGFIPMREPKIRGRSVQTTFSSSSSPSVKPIFFVAKFLTSNNKPENPFRRHGSDSKSSFKQALIMEWRIGCSSKISIMDFQWSPVNSLMLPPEGHSFP